MKRLLRSARNDSLAQNLLFSFGRKAELGIGENHFVGKPAKGQDLDRNGILGNDQWVQMIMVPVKKAVLTEDAREIFSKKNIQQLSLLDVCPQELLAAEGLFLSHVCLCHFIHDRSDDMPHGLVFVMLSRFLQRWQSTIVPDLI